MKKNLKYVYAFTAAMIVGGIFRYFDNDFIGGWMGCLAYLEVLKLYRDRHLDHCINEVEKAYKILNKSKIL